MGRGRAREDGAVTKTERERTPTCDDGRRGTARRSQQSCKSKRTERKAFDSATADAVSQIAAATAKDFAFDAAVNGVEYLYFADAREQNVRDRAADSDGARGVCTEIGFHNRSQRRAPEEPKGHGAQNEAKAEQTHHDDDG